ncbi:alpha/beta fold hydrolase BchO [Sandaracinobacteroides saxicola]|uniref:Alpha/beta fold hydrolase n=1 Tax=Sandaracinobacteroides saxicola TaxID=2759707 RepID=A0A7G5IKS3_9SPHN|nr:alpha/beta fold hydrolase BchO [Sandaracinobacteroides saxicola]QMW23965.1 alpha/beta fold hydrolase [Sandaracinobacteroides saxicola]
MGKPSYDIEGRDWPHREASRFIEAGGVRWHVQVAGEGPDILLLHGTGAATHSWAPLWPLLVPHGRLIAVDLPGHGFSGRGDLRLPGMARGVAALLPALGVEPALLVGHSAGAAVAVQLALDGMRAPILSINGSLLPFPGVAGLLFPAAAKLLFLNPLTPRMFALRARLPGEVGRFMARATGSRIPEPQVALYARLLATSGHVGAALGMMANWDLEALAARLPTLDMPLTLIAGEKDAAVPADVARQVAAKVPGAEVVMLPGVGHLAHEEAPHLVAPYIIRALTGGRDG